VRRRRRRARGLGRRRPTPRRGTSRSTSPWRGRRFGLLCGAPLGVERSTIGRAAERASGVTEGRARCALEIVAVAFLALADGAAAAHRDVRIGYRTRELALAAADRLERPADPAAPATR